MSSWFFWVSANVHLSVNILLNQMRSPNETLPTQSLYVSISLVWSRFYLGFLQVSAHEKQFEADYISTPGIKLSDFLLLCNTSRDVSLYGLMPRITF